VALDGTQKLLGAAKLRAVRQGQQSSPGSMVHGRSTNLPKSAQEILRRLAALLMNPSRASKIVEYLVRYARFWADLRFHEKFQVSISHLLDGMAVRRMTRNGQSRRYRLSYAVLRQDFADGGHVTASHLRDIISHFDDYV
jgi:hypothetical protein